MLGSGDVEEMNSRIIMHPDDILALRLSQRKVSNNSLYARHIIQYKVALGTGWE